MAKAQPEVRRAAKSSIESKRIRFSQIEIDKSRDFCHRAAEALKAESVAPLTSSLILEGQQTPLSVYDSGRTDAKGRKVFLLVSGFRRFFALREAIQQNLDSGRIHDEMEVEVVEVMPGAEQDEQSFNHDLLIRSVSENEQRKQFTTEEKLDVVKRFREEKIPDPRAASALSVSDTQYRRFVSIVSHPWLHAYVVNNCISVSDAAALIEVAEKKEWVSEFKQDFDSWVRVQQAKIEEERRELSKVGKKLSGSAEHVKKFINPKLVRHWTQLIEQKKRFDDNVKFTFGILVDEDKKSITVPSATLKIDELSSADFELLIGELQDATDKFLPLMRERQVIESAVSISEEEKQQELQRIREERRTRKAQEAEAAAGRPAEDFGKVDSLSATEVNVEDEQPSSLEADSHSSTGT